MNLSISGKPRIKRLGDFPGQWSKMRSEEGRENIVPIYALIKGAEGDGEGEQEGSYPACARLPCLMSLKGQMPLQKNNGFCTSPACCFTGIWGGRRGQVHVTLAYQTRRGRHISLMWVTQERVNCCKYLKDLSGITQWAARGYLKSTLHIRWFKYKSL